MINDAYYGVSDHLQPKHFFEPLYQLIYEVAGPLTQAGKVVTPITVKTFLPTDVTSPASRLAVARGRLDV